MAWGEETMTVREWRRRRERWDGYSMTAALSELLRECGICGLDGRRHEFDCPMGDTWWTGSR